MPLLGQHNQQELRRGADGDARGTGSPATLGAAAARPRLPVEEGESGPQVAGLIPLRARVRRPRSTPTAGRRMSNRCLAALRITLSPQSNANIEFLRSRVPLATPVEIVL